MKVIVKKFFSYKLFLVFIVSVITPLGNLQAQFENVWMSVGSLHNKYSEIGSELEDGSTTIAQQTGMQWPANYRSQDMQAARGWWIGCKDFTDENGIFFPYKVVNVGPRNPQFFSAFPIQMDLISKFEPTVVNVDGNPSIGKDVTIDRIDPDMPWDRMIINKVATAIGVTMERKIFQFSQQYNDNYIFYEYTFTNTGDTDGDTTIIELPSNTITDLYTFWTYRNAVNRSVRFVIGNSTGWGENTMNDARGDGNPAKPDPVGEQFRAQFSWHGFATTKQVAYDNIGAPIWTLDTEALKWNAKEDTIGRLGGTQFLGVATLYADKSAAEKVDDLNQPSTTTHQGSDDKFFLAGANSFNSSRMEEDYLFMAKGHQYPRHADEIEPSGDFANQKNNPGAGSGQGGYSFNNGYGPYTLQHGESIKIVVVEAAAGMNRADQIRYGRQFKNGQITALQKNQLVINKGRDSLFTTFQRAKENFESSWNIPQPPKPPLTFDVNSGGDRISLSWTVGGDDPNPATAYRVYRALGDNDQEYTMIAELGPEATSYDDINVIRGFNYFYYITAVGVEQLGGPATPSGKLESSRFYTQTFDAANLQRPAESDMSKIRVVPNPYIIDSDVSVRFPGNIDEDKIAFYNIPGNCTIRIYTELGELIKTIEHTDGSGDEFWFSVTSSNQFVVSGIYIAVVTDNTTGENHISKFAIIR